LKNYLNRGDFLDLLLKLYEKGIGNVLAKLHFDDHKRTRAAFNKDQSSSNWWIIPQVKERWNQLITGFESTDYEQYLCANILADKKNLRMLSIGCGVGNHEINFAQCESIGYVLGVDLAENLIHKANSKVSQLGLPNCEFRSLNVLETNFTSEFASKFDVVLFHSSLHHFDKIENFLNNIIKPLLSDDGMLILNEFVGPTRLQWTGEQIDECNRLLKTLPKSYRKTKLPFYHKSRVNRPGLVRMKMADPSEAIDSGSIYPTLHKSFETLIERPFGGNILHLLLKDIAHNFTDNSEETQNLLVELFAAEDKFIESRPSDFLVGVYRFKN